MAVNARSVFLASKHVLKFMLAQNKDERGDRGWIINISSIFGLIGGRFNCKAPSWNEYLPCIMFLT